MSSVNTGYRCSIEKTLLSLARAVRKPADLTVQLTMRTDQDVAKRGGRARLHFVSKGADAYHVLVEYTTSSSSAVQGDAAGYSSALALYDLGVNYLVRASLECQDAGEGIGLIGHEVFHVLPEVARLRG